MTTKFDDFIMLGKKMNPQEKLGYLFWQINMQWVRKVNQLVGQFDMSHTQLLTLVGTKWLGTKQEEVIQQDLVELIKIDRMLVSKMVKKNEEAGFLEKKSSKSDSRVNVLQLTVAGQERISQVVPLLMRADEEFYGLLGDQKEPLTKQLQQLLERVEEHMKKSNNT